jgi:hypothetical protein
MPAPLSEGGPIVLCDSGLAGVFPRGLAHRTPAHHAHSHHDNTEHAAREDAPAQQDAGQWTHDSWQYCPFGALSSTAPIAVDFALRLLELGSERAASLGTRSAGIAAFRHYQARAPPSTLSI